MIVRTPELEALERRWERDAYYGLSVEELLARYSALWAHALEIGPDPLEGWEEALEADFAVARAVNGLPPS